jgi:CO dehydrogenase maturation factor
VTPVAEGERSPRDIWLVETMARRSAGLDELESRADDAFGWLAVERHASSLLRHLGTWLDHGRLQRARPDIERHQADLVAARDRARRQLAALGPVALDDARRRLGLRLALMGKGGVGKTVISSTLARLLGRRGRNVLAFDLDANPGLAISLGLPMTEAGLPLEAVVEQKGSAYGWALAPHLSPVDVVDRYAVRAADNVHFLGMGKIGSSDRDHSRRSVVALLHVLLNFTEPGWHVIADMEAGPTTPFEHYHAFADDVIVVVGPAWRSAMTARRLLPMVGDSTTTIVANRFRDEPDHPGLHPVIRIPYDPEVAEAERQGLSPLDACPDSPAVAAIARLAEQFLNQEVRT